jgi:hypothetical protein
MSNVQQTFIPELLWLGLLAAIILIAILLKRGTK